MTPPQPWFFDALQKYDQDFYKGAIALRGAVAGSALDAKTRLLISMVLDGTAGNKERVNALARQARESGATDGEVREVLRLLVSHNMNMALAVSTYAFEDLPVK